MLTWVLVQIGWYTRLTLRKEFLYTVEGTRSARVTVLCNAGHEYRLTDTVNELLRDGYRVVNGNLQLFVPNGDN